MEAGGKHLGSSMTGRNAVEAAAGGELLGSGMACDEVAGTIKVVDLDQILSAEGLGALRYLS